MDSKDRASGLLRLVKAKQSIQFGSGDILIAYLDKHVVALIFAEDVDYGSRLTASKANAIRFIIQELE